MYNVENLKNIPSNPGVYLMKNKLDEIMYVGKAKNLNKRVKQYFNDEMVKKRGPKIMKMVSLIEDIEWIVTNTEVEALILENNLIKENHPKYNTLLLDDKTYPYIKITNEEYPKIIFTRKIEKDGAVYYGPFTDVTAINNTIDLLKDIFSIRHCDYINLPKKECIYYQMNKCIGPCIKSCKEEYILNINNIKKILSGNNKEIKKQLEEKMLLMSNELNFEDAAKYRDLIHNLDKITLKQNINNDFDSQDIIAYSKVKDKAIIVIFFIRNGKLVNKTNFSIKIMEENEVLSSFVQQYYSNIVYFPKEIIIGENIENLDLLNNWISTKSNFTKIIYVQKGHKNTLYELAQKNVQLLINEDLQKIENKEKKINKELKEIEDIIGHSINRIESYDISNTSGCLNVASMVVFEEKQFKKNSYRKFRLNFVGADDYSCMKEVIKRRFTDDKMKFYPDLLLIDGGKGQVNAVKEILNNLDINVNVCGMVKDDNHRTRGLYYENIEYPIKNSINLITRIQDETHNFAVSYHSLLRTKEMLHSILEDIPGIGPKKRQSLLTQFGSVEKIKSLSKEELATNNLLNNKDVENIYSFFNNV